MSGQTDMDFQDFVDISGEFGEILFVLNVKPSLQFSFLNDVIVKVLGYTSDEFKVQPEKIFQTAFIEDLEKIRDELFHSVQKVGSFVYRWVHKLGRILWLKVDIKFIRNSAGEIICIKGKATDVTEKHELIEKVKYSEQRFVKILNLAPVAILEIDAEGGCLFANDLWYYLSGLSKQNSLGIGWRTCVYSEDRRKILDFIIRAQEAKLTDQFDFRIVTPDGKITWLDFNAYCIRDSYGVVKKFICSGIDITERKRIESELQISQRLMDETSRIAKVGGWEIDLLENKLTWTREVFNIHELPYDYVPTVETSIGYYAPECVKKITDAVDNAIKFSQPFDLELQIITAKGRRVWVHARGSTVSILGNVTKVLGTFQDIQDKVNYQQKMNILATALEQGLVGVVITDREGKIEYTNSLFNEMTGYTAFDLLGKTPEVLSSGLMPKEFYSNLWDTIEKGQTWRGEFQNRKKSGELYWEKANITPIRDFFGNISHFVGMKEDITELKKVQAELKSLATTDPLTGVFNRATGMAILEKHMHLSWRNRKPLCISFIDIDGLKQVNDTFGHAEGDELIRTVCSVIQSCIRTTDSLARMGGDEFMIVFPECEEKNAEILNARISNSLIEKSTKSGKPYELHFSYGLQEYPSEERKSADEFIELADMRMYEQKKKKKTI